jgi:DNA-binding transcriptional LysR family regulator
MMLRWGIVEIRQLEYFVAVAESRSFVRASQRLYVGQPAVSQQLARLERELGVRLFDRSSRHVRLTAAGERLLPEAQAALAAVRRVQQVADDVSEGTDLVLRLGTSPALGDRLHRVLHELSSRAPRLVVRLTSLHREQRLAAVRSGELDAALVRVLEHAADLDVVPVWRDPLLVALPENHPLASHPSVRLEQLAELPLRLAPEAHNPAFHALITTALREAGVQPPTGRPFTTLPDTLAEIGTGPPSWTVFNADPRQPAVPRVALRPLAGLTASVSVATRPGTASRQVRLLLAACAALSEEDADL